MSQYYARRSPEVTDLERRNQSTVRALAGECMVLLENDGTLPFTPDVKTIALYGRGARATIKGGTGSGDVNSREVINIEQGLAAAGYKISSKDWIDLCQAEREKDYRAYVEDANKKAEETGVPAIMIMMGTPFMENDEPLITEKAEADAAVYVIARNSGEGADRYDRPGDYELTANEEANIRFLAANYEKTVVLLNIGGIIDTKALRATEGVNALLLVGQTGNMGGHIVADVLKGRAIPSGRLTDTWAENYEDYPSSKNFSHNNGDIDDEYYTEGIYVGYRYFDTFGVKPAYPFGFGRSYTTFKQRVKSVKADANEVVVTVEVENAGTHFAGREVVQVYVAAPKGAIAKPVKELRGFAKTTLLEPGEEETVEIRFATASMASYAPACPGWVLEKGDYVVLVGTNACEVTPAAILRLDQDVVTVKTKNLFAADAEYEEIAAPEGGADCCCAGADLPVIALAGASFSTETVVYQGERPILEDKRPGEKLTMADVKAGKATLEELVAQLTVEELAGLAVGVYDTSANVIGSASHAVPGAAGDSLPIPDRGVTGLVLADGPAGLRLQPHFKAMPDGTLLKGGETFGTETVPFPEDTPAEAIDYYQWCTAIPIASTLAQSWDMPLIEKMGNIVGKEMQELHVHLWLAPGMNIHRNPLCGRNFEYYSEDPFLTGCCAAADTKGVQAFPGQGTTIKHFAANSQEDNRMFNNAHVSERALREIYLKGFEIAVRTAQPLSIMTSYNLINGIHSANNYDLLQSAARDEWGFKGVVMTDWFTSQDVTFLGMKASDKYPISSSPLCVKAGNDMQMPGCEKNVTDLLEAVAKGEVITKGDLQFCAYNVLKIVLLTI